MRFFLTLLLLLSSRVFAEDGRLLTLSVPPEAGERYQTANFSCWLPDTDEPVTAVIIHQHGCTNASPDKHPAITGDAHWKALARKHGCALLVPQYFVEGSCDQWNDPESGSERALFAALAELAKQSGRNELEKVPWVLWGHSGGSSWSVQMMVRHPARVLGASFRGGCSKQFGVPEFRAQFLPVAREIPMLFVWGLRESVPASSHFVSWEPMNTMYRELRSSGGHVARVVDPRSEHGCDNSRLLVIPFFDAVLAARFGETPMPGAYVDLDTLESRAETPEAESDPALGWLPNGALASRWVEFSNTGSLQPVDPVLTTPELQVLCDAKGIVELKWNVTPALDGGYRGVRVYRDGMLWKVQVLAEDAFLATSRDSTPELLRVESMRDDSSGDHTYTVTFLDVAGNESPPSPAVKP
jgi:hypothetical protein